MPRENPYGVFTVAQTAIANILSEADPCSVNLEVGDMTKGQMLEFAEAFRAVSNYARSFERQMRTEAKHSFY